MTDVAVGQVAVLEDTGLGIVRAHRIVWITATSSEISLTTRGDANPSDDAPVSIPREGAVPVVMASVPWLGYLASLFGRPSASTIGLGLLPAADVTAVLITLFPRAGTNRSKEERSAPSQEGR